MGEPLVIEYMLDVVPSPPESARYIDWMRWLLAVLNRDNRSKFVFVSSVFNYCIDHAVHPTEKQAKVIDKITEDTLLLFHSGALEIQEGVANGQVKH